MPDPLRSRLSPRQLGLLDAWLPGAQVVRDHSWGLTSTVVLEVAVDDRTYAVKAAAPDDHHLVHELRAHAQWLEPWTSVGAGPILRFGDESARILVTEWVPGSLVQGSGAEGETETYRQAGALLARMHGQSAVEDPGHEGRETARMLAWLDRPHGIPGDQVERVRAEVERWPDDVAVLVPTHGDWQPRNWVVDDGTVRVIDLGRADLRPAYTDWARLAVQQFVGRPDLERAFVEGYGSDPREPRAWRRQLLREAVSTAAWAHQVGDEGFEAQGLRMLVAALQHDDSTQEVS
ncbi:hypothetical protein GCM10022415_26240 [Knoellia locipacati]|uniref:Aminoglycoside phosphotransferase n=1 Tax=Knoellia locipacati TaxID=882824 RepID=A0A512T339_9MICO|nr:phosphotransferase [Knoellia locipacati]GEQ14573.1 hypothetical protein KLO01_26200 [Knoellia locipacati]